ncbi:MAG: uroporphyrinogen-III synthase [Acidimicrobiia bacterium]
MPSADQPLAGRTIVVTRAAEQGRRFTELLSALGADVIELPLIAVVDAPDGGSALREATDRLREFDWIVVTSPNGASRLAALLPPASSGEPLPRIAAIGAATEAALGTGRSADLVAGTAVAEGLLDDLAGVAPARVLVVQGDRARPALVDGLRAMGWAVERVVAYRTVPARPPADELWRALDADAITFASASTVQSFVEAVGSAERHPPVVVSIGPETTAAAVHLGLGVTATADPHSLDGMVAALVAALGRR